MTPQIFRWDRIACNTFVAMTPMGWILRSVDTKNTVLEDQENVQLDGADEDNRVTVAMSTSMIEITDPMHDWHWDRFRWINIAEDTWRAMVVGGWIVKHVEVRDTYNEYGESHKASSCAMVFVSDPSHGWQARKPYKTRTPESGEQLPVHGNRESDERDERDYDPLDDTQD